MKNAINWFEIPVTDFERAKKFYSVLMGEQLIDHRMPNDSIKHGVFPYETGAAGIGGAIV
ncbi:MAG: putative enzyme related to lactoylglutathione lyase [Crocinitomicaceae bacterium]|jgi:predicted enzyme related to lactoylglutathione lyase